MSVPMSHMPQWVFIELPFGKLWGATVSQEGPSFEFEEPARNIVFKVAALDTEEGREKL